MKSRKFVVAPLAAAVGTAFLASAAVAADDLNNDTVFGAVDLDQQAIGEGKDKEKGKEGSCGEGSCGEDHEKGKEGACGEGSCGEDHEKGKEGACGEGSCGESGEEGACGEGSCGAA